MVFKTWLSDINKVALAMDGLQNITQFKTGSTIANGMELSTVAVNKYKASIEGLTLSQAKTALSTTALNEAQQNQILISAGLITSTDSVTAADVKQAVAENVLTTVKQQEVLATFEAEMAEGKMSLERLQAIALEDTEAGAIARVILAKKEENAQNLKNIASGKALTTVLKEQLLALASNPMTWVVAGLAGVVTVAYQCSQAIEEVEAKAQELNETFSTSKTEIEDYKTQIDDLYKVINDSGSSIEDVTTARQNLMSIQDQLIEKFGDEKGAIDLITDAINGQTDALNILTEAQWQAAKNEFNESGFWNDVANGIAGYSNNIDRMLSEYESYSVTIDMSEYGGTLFTEGYDEFKQMLMDDFGATISKSSTAALELSGSASEVRQKLLDIQEILKENSTYKPDDTFSDYLGGLERSANDVVEKYEDFYKQYILYEEIFTNDTFTDSYKKINKAYSEYQDAFATGDEESIKRAQDNFASILTQATEGVSDESVVDFFNDMYPDLQEVVGNWQFEMNFTANTDGLKDDVSGYLSGLDGLYSYDLKNFSYDTATEEQKASYDGLISVARLYGLTIDQLIDKLVLMGLVQDEEYQRLVDKFGKENVAKIAPEDLTFAYQIKNVGDMSFEEFQAEIQRLKDEASNPDETDIQFSDIFALKDSEGKLNELGKINEEIDKFQSAYKGLKEVMDSYNETGTFTLDQVQEIISYGGDYLKYLMDENGNLQLNEEALNKVAIARINEMRAKALSNLMDNLDKITNEEQALSYLETQLLNTATAYDALTANRIKAWSENALENGISQETINKVTKSFKNQVSAINEMFNNISLDSIYKSSSSSASSATKDAEKATKDYIDSYMDYMEQSLESGRIDYQTYSRDVAKFLKDMYDQGKIAAKDYHDYTKEMLEVQKSAMDGVISAVTYRLDKEIDSYEDQINAVEERYQTEIDYLDTVIEYYEDQKKALQDTNDELDRQKALEEALYNFERAQDQKTQKVNYMPSYYSNVVCKK